MMPKNILLVEDDFLNRRLTKKILVQSDYNVLEAKNSREALRILEAESVDLIILDINLGEDDVNGIELSHQINEKYRIPFIYLTAYENPEIIGNALKSTPYSYLTKPFKNIDLITAIELAIRKDALATKETRTIVVKDDDFKKELNLDDIYYLASEGNYLLIHTCDSIYKIRSTIKQIQETLPDDVFVQVHRAFIVNKSKIEKFNNKFVYVKDTAIPVSRNFLDELNLG